MKEVVISFNPLHNKTKFKIVINPVLSKIHKLKLSACFNATL